MSNASPLVQLAIRNAIKSIVCGSFFDICGVDKLLEIAGMSNKRNTPEHKLLSHVHCVSWTEFDSAAKQELLQCLSTLLEFDISAHAPSSFITLPSSSMEVK